MFHLLTNYVHYENNSLLMYYNVSLVMFSTIRLEERHIL